MDTVSVFSPYSGEKLRSFGKHSNFGVEGNFRNPHRVAIEGVGHSCSCQIYSFVSRLPPQGIRMKPSGTHSVATQKKI